LLTAAVEDLTSSAFLLAGLKWSGARAIAEQKLQAGLFRGRPMIEIDWLAQKRRPVAVPAALANAWARNHRDEQERPDN